MLSEMVWPSGVNTGNINSAVSGIIAHYVAAVQLPNDCEHKVGRDAELSCGEGNWNKNVQSNVWRRVCCTTTNTGTVDQNKFIVGTGRVSTQLFHPQMPVLQELGSLVAMVADLCCGSVSLTTRHYPLDWLPQNACLLASRLAHCVRGSWARPSVVEKQFASNFVFTKGIEKSCCRRDRAVCNLFEPHENCQ